MRLQAVCIVVTVIITLGHAAQAAGDPDRGAKVFRQCAACHSVASGEQLTGPSLAHVWTRKAGNVEGFTRYSEAMKRSDVTWGQATLDKWLTDPDRFIRGTSMTFAGIKDAQSRQDVIAYLQAVSEGKTSHAKPGGGMMGGMMGGGRKPDLHKAPPEGQVRSIKYCGDAYTVETADGKRQKVWEFNLRFKTDSSDRGPSPGKPVVIGAGMQGDRASIVFASPAEISAFIRQACD